MDIESVVFDMDGLLLDTEKLYQRFWREASSRCGYDMTQDHALMLRSLDKNLAVKLLKELFGESFDYKRVHDLRVELMEEYIKENGVEAKRGVREICTFLKENGYKTAIATATNFKRADRHLSLAGIRDLFADENIICASGLEHGKPYPDIYLFACKKLNTLPSKALALEDSPNGVKSAYSAGCKVICIPDRGEVEEEIKPLITYSANSLEDVIGLIKLS
ncbi:MAG: HAD family phosphatase [Clostridia bacterium]|nr:HAD family phosphatase [Clostridia bacterium]